MISQDQFNLYVQDTLTLWSSFLANGYYLPKIPKSKKHPFMQEKMVKEMYNDLVHISKYSEMNFLPCVDPPSASFLRDELVRIIESNEGYTS